MASCRTTVVPLLFSPSMHCLQSSQACLGPFPLTRTRVEPSLYCRMRSRRSAYVSKIGTNETFTVPFFLKVGGARFRPVALLGQRMGPQQGKKEN